MHIRGTFEEVGLAELARFVAATRQSGVLKVFAEPSGLVCFVEGRLDVAYRSHGSHRERLSAYSTAPDPLEERRMERDRLAELMRLDQSGAAFSFESKQVEPSGLPPLDLDVLGRLVGRRGPGAAPEPAAAPQPAPVRPAVEPLWSPDILTPTTAESLGDVMVGQTPVPSPAVPVLATRQLARAQRTDRSRGGALARLIGAVRQRQGDQ